MAESITMPQLGESVTEGTIVRWLVRVGEQVNKYDPLCEVTTDKVSAEVPSVLSGIVTEIVASEGETVEAGAVICRIEADSGSAESADAGQEALLSAMADSGLGEAVPARTEPVYSPAVWKLIQEHGLDPSRLQGTGRSGRITRSDVLEFLERGAPSAAVSSAGAAPSPRGLSETDETIPVTPVRKAIAQRMTQSKREIPHAWMMLECDATNLVRARQAIKDEFLRTEGIALTYFPFFLKAVAESLKEFPIVNSQWAGDRIVLRKEINLSIAVAADRALFAPVIRNADRMDITGLARAVHGLARKAREGRLTADDLSGGTFTVNNTGSFGSVLSAPIINYPQAAILSVEAIVKRPAIVERMLVERDKVNICLSMDHRILDGWVCGQFLQHLRQKIEGVGPDTGFDRNFGKENSDGAASRT
ncbi:dihydrolipoamide acetyltransferase family protein [Paenibacillus sp. GYB003]|uniref:dihydrolipoamide acetyltransferase family protein n=1 Tax=Paenibacillus sp. GYB003 TaxID=2994392 RepID=UPI002F963256